MIWDLTPGSGLVCPNHFFPDIRPQRFRHHHAAILLLVVLDDRHPRAPHREAAAVERVHMLVLLANAVADVGPPRLVSFKVTAGRDLLVAILPRQPDFDIVGLGARSADV